VPADFESASTAADLGGGVSPSGGVPGGGVGPGGGAPPAGAAGNPPAATRTDDETFLRGAQVTNAVGIVQFRTIYPGWYTGRTVHIHAKVHLDSSTVLTTQFFFDERITADVYATEPYSGHPARDTFNDTDGIFDPSLILATSDDDEGYLAVMTLNVRSA
jgi:protocatechuate 3,4-dioxygenase beta subunit